MEKITGNNRKLIENCITFARKFLVLPEPIEIFFEDCPSDRFPKANNAAESEGNRLFFNKQWFLKSKAGHIDDIEFYVYHELRHISISRDRIALRRRKNARATGYYLKMEI